jgi:ABC-type phosphate transport system substrate-binding protein
MNFVCYNKKMNKIIILTGGFLVLLIFGGCLSSTTHIIYDDPTPPEQKCTLTIAGSITITQFDGKAVKWSPAFGVNWADLQIPEGSHTFIVDFSTGGGQYTANDIIVTYNDFEAGHHYRMVPLIRPPNVSIAVQDITQ